MSGIYSTKIPTLDTLEDVDINPSTLSNNDVIQYNSTTREWDNVVLGNPYLLTMYGTQGLYDLTQNTDTVMPFTNANAYGSASASDWDIGDKEWTCPVSGLYHFVLQCYGEDSNNDSLVGWENYIEHAPQSAPTTFSRISIAIIYAGSDDDLASICNNVSRYYVVNAGDKIRGLVRIRVNSGIGRLDFQNERSYLQIAKLI